MVLWIDSTLFNGDLIMKLRLKYMYPHVTKFYICEQRYTHQGQRKDVLYIESCKDWFTPYLDKIVFLVDEQSDKDSWTNEYRHRNYAANRIYDDMKGHTYIISVCDCDEIPDGKIVVDSIEEIYTKTTTGALHMNQQLMYYNLQWHISEWNLAYFINNISLETYRDLEGYRSGKLKSNGSIICGWHCSFFMSVGDIIRKIQSFSHSEYNKTEYTNKEFIEKCVNKGIDVFKRDGCKLYKNSKKIEEYPIEFQEFHNELLVPKEIYTYTNHMSTLASLVDNSLTDKNTTHSYLELYETLLQSKKNTAERILEIGIGDFGPKNGGSIKLWRDYFTNATIYGVDIISRDRVVDNLLNHPRVVLHTSTNGYSGDFVKKTFLDTNTKFDMMLDDGPHSLESMLLFISLYSPLLKDDGLLIIEDVQKMEWLDVLKSVVPESLKQYVEIYDLRHVKGRYDDIVFVINKSKK